MGNGRFSKLIYCNTSTVEPSANQGNIAIEFAGFRDRSLYLNDERNALLSSTVSTVAQRPNVSFIIGCPTCMSRHIVP